MRPGSMNRPGGMTLVATGLVLLGFGVGAGRADEPRGLGRLFRLGSGSNGSAAKKPAPGARTSPRGASSSGTAANATPVAPLFGTEPPGNLPMPSASLPDVGAGSTPYRPSPSVVAASATGSATTAAMTPPPSAGAAPRLRPQPRNTQAATEADPILTRIALGRTDDGKQFGMFLQVYSDGTVIDSEGVHHVGADVMKPLAQALQAAELGSIKGHCGGPPTDFIEQVHLTVYERSRGKMRSNTFSFSGNPAGCEPAVKVLNNAIEALMTRLSGPPVASPAPASGDSASADAPPPPPVSAPTLELTPGN